MFIKNIANCEIMGDLTPTIHWDITDKCNFRCKYCYFYSDYKKDKIINNLNFDIFKDIKIKFNVMLKGGGN